MLSEREEIILAHFGKLQHWAFRVALFVAALLLIRFALDLTNEMSVYLAAPFWLLVFASLAVCGANLFLPEDKDLAGASKWQLRLLIAAIPLGSVASSLGCTGLSAQGCSSLCTFIKIAWIPLIATLALAYYIVARRESASNPTEKRRAGALQQGFILALLAASFVPLAPHCVCYNAANAWWIDRIGASPTCYVWGFMASLISLSALRTGARLRLSITLAVAIVGGGLAFFVGHHYFHFPW